MTFEEWLTRIPAGPAIDAPCFFWDKERINDDHKAKAKGYPFGVLYPFGDTKLQEFKGCCTHWERLYNLKVLQCPKQYSALSFPSDRDTTMLDEFVAMLKQISHNNVKKIVPDGERIEAVSGLVGDYKFSSFTHESTPQAKTKDIKLRGQYVMMRFSLKWQTC